MPLLHAVAAFAAAVSGHAAADVHHYEYVFPDEHIVVYDIDHGHRQIEDDDLPGITGIRGVAVDPASHALYLSHGGDGGQKSREGRHRSNHQGDGKNGTAVSREAT